MSWSGGKDSAWALHQLRSGNQFEVVGILSTLTRGFDRIAMHGIRRDILVAQAQALGVELIESWQDASPSNEQYEQAFQDALTAAQRRWPGLNHIAFGDLFLQDIREYRDALCTRTGWQAVYPLFGVNTAALARTMIDGGLRAKLCCVDTRQLDACFAGEVFDRALLDRLPENIDPCGEYGEFHSCVYDGPMFSKALQLSRGESVRRDGQFEYVDFELR